MNIIIVMFVLASFSCNAMQHDGFELDLYTKSSRPCDEVRLACVDQLKLDDKSDINTIVHVGCNTGDLCDELAERYPDKTIVGIDPKSEALDIAVRKTHRRNNVNFFPDSALTFKLAKPADVALCYHLLHWFPRQEIPAVLANIASNVAEGGVLDISTGAQQGSTGLTSAALWTLFWYPRSWATFAETAWKKQHKKLTLLTAPELTEMVTQAGFEVKECREEEQVLTFKSQEEFAHWVHMSLALFGIAKMRADHRKSFVKDVATLYGKHYNPGKDGIEYRSQVLRLTALKAAVRRVNVE